MKHVRHFLLGFLMCFLFFVIFFPHVPVQSSYGLALDGSDVVTPLDLTEIVKYILSTFGGIVTAILLKFLKKKFPQWFETAKEKAKRQISDEEKP